MMETILIILFCEFWHKVNVKDCLNPKKKTIENVRVITVIAEEEEEEYLFFLTNEMKQSQT